LYEHKIRNIYRQKSKYMKNSNKGNMMEIELRKVGIEHLEILVDLRIEFIKDIHPEIDFKLLEKIQKVTLSYFNDLLNNNSYIGFIGINNNGEIICTAGLIKK